MYVHSCITDSKHTHTHLYDVVKNNSSYRWTQRHITHKHTDRTTLRGERIRALEYLSVLLSRLQKVA